VIATRRKNRKGEYLVIHYYRPERAFNRTLKGSDPATAAYQRSLLEAQTEYQRFVQAGRPQIRRNAHGTRLDERGMAITKPPSERYRERFGGFDVIDETTLAWLAREFLASAQVRALKKSTRDDWETLLHRVCRLAHPKHGPDVVLGDGEFASMRKEHVLQLRERFAGTPSRADTVIKILRAMYFWAEEVGYHDGQNPAARLGQLRQSQGISTLTYEEHGKFCARWPVGTRQRLAYDLALYSGCRVCDLHQLGPQHVKNGWLHWTENKGRDSTALKRRPKTKRREWKIHPELAASIATTTHGIRHFIVRADGKPFAKPDRLSRAFVLWAREAGIDKTAHGIRKLGATMLADNGADLITIRDFLGHSSFAEAQTYIAARDKRRVSERAIELIRVPA
jgi:integrase